MALLPQHILNQSVLVVDDMQSMRAILVALLRSMGFSNITQAENGEKAMKKLARKPVDIILSDWDMPAMTGIEFLQKVRNELQHDSVFLLITANDSAEKVKMAKEAGVDDYIVKPITFQQVQARLEAAFGIKK